MLFVAAFDPLSKGDQKYVSNTLGAMLCLISFLNPAEKSKFLMLLCDDLITVERSIFLQVGNSNRAFNAIDAL